MPGRITAVTIAVLIAGSGLSAAAAGPLETLERERAALLGVALNPELTPQERADRLELTRRRLLDIEAIALRDPSARSDRRPIARRAFADYDTTFLGHASVEFDRTPFGQWLDRVGLSSARVLAAGIGRR